MEKENTPKKFYPAGTESIFSEEICFESNFSELLSMKPAFVATAKIIRDAISDGMPVYVRHHADADGYAGGIALEKAIAPIIRKLRFNDTWRYFDRQPSKSPFYDYSDVLRDIISSKRNTERFGSKLPLVVLVDIGSTKEDLLALRRAKIHGLKVVVVDHHSPGKVEAGKSAVDKYIESHINPYLFGHDKNITAGMLAYELARTIDTGVYAPILPAVAGTGDKSHGKIFDEYVKESGEAPEFLKKLALCVDFEAYHLRFMNDSGIISELLTLSDSARKTVELLSCEIVERITAQKAVIKEYSTVETLENGFVMGLFDAENCMEQGRFPSTGKTSGIFMEFLSEKHKNTPIIAIVFTKGSLSMRADNSAAKRGFDLNKLVQELASCIPETQIEGGGHNVAGALRFVPAGKNKVLEGIKQYISKLA
ncbi:MAG: hypothetical protein KAJ24_06840 [Candidatus Aenigmarchaeota archaeon]|nr:hypothetical protein [Candidatus Aenigmarchaeota archaeon]